MQKTRPDRTYIWMHLAQRRTEPLHITAGHGGVCTSFKDYVAIFVRDKTADIFDEQALSGHGNDIKDRKASDADGAICLDRDDARASAPACIRGTRRQVCEGDSRMKKSVDLHDRPFLQLLYGDFEGRRAMDLNWEPTLVCRILIDECEIEWHSLECRRSRDSREDSHKGQQNRNERRDL
jgi:hypothetical protein